MAEAKPSQTDNVKSEKKSQVDTLTEALKLAQSQVASMYTKISDLETVGSASGEDLGALKLEANKAKSAIDAALNGGKV